MFCMQCGAQIDNNYGICPACGAKLPEENAAQQASAANQQPQYNAQPNGQYNQQYGQYNQQYGQYNQQYAQPNGQYNQQYAQPNAQYNQQAYGAPAPKRSVSFGEAIKLFFSNYANFTGRATKSEYWWAFLFTFLIGLIPGVGQLAAVVFLIPNLAIGIRRLHDSGKPWPYIFMSLIPLAGFIIMIVLFCQDSDGDNRWGPAPRG